MAVALGGTSVAGAAQQLTPGGLEGAAPPQVSQIDRLRAIYGDRTVAVVGDGIITERDVVAYLRDGRLEEDPAELFPNAPEAEIGAMRFEAALAEIIDDRLMTVGGETLGFEPELIGRAVDNQVRSFIEREGGEQRAAARFQRMGINREQLRSIYEQRMLGSSWEATVTGRGPGATGRFVVDSYVRPGKRFSRYREFETSQNPEAMAKVGKSPGLITIRQLPVEPRGGAAGLDEAERTLTALRSQILDGTFSFEEVLFNVARADFRGEAGYVRDLTPAQLERLFRQVHPDQGDEIAAFLEGAQAGALSPVLPIRQNGRLVAFTIYRVESYADPRPALPFSSRELQEQLVEAIEEEREDVYVYRGLAKLARSTHVSPDRVREWLLQRGQAAPRGDQSPQEAPTAPDAPPGQGEIPPAGPAAAGSVR